VPAWIAYLDAQQRYLYVNAYYAVESGVAPDDIIGRSLADVVGKERYATMKEKIDEALQGVEVKYELTMGSRHGLVHQHVHYIPDVGDDGKARGLFSIVTTIKKSETSTH
jgi:PAS domain S-box-containing protein